jgi:hypothetical protein
MCIILQKTKKALPLYKNTRVMLFLFCKKKKGVGNADTADLADCTDFLG